VRKLVGRTGWFLPCPSNGCKTARATRAQTPNKKKERKKEKQKTLQKEDCKKALSGSDPSPHLKPGRQSGFVSSLLSFCDLGVLTHLFAVNQVSFPVG
jgi:hypothetical protein